jgi:hypothetical protein
MAEEAGARLARFVCSVAIGGTAMFAEPTVTEIEEVGSLTQENRGQKSENRGQRTEVKQFKSSSFSLFCLQAAT